MKNRYSWKIPAAVIIILLWASIITGCKKESSPPTEKSAPAAQKLSPGQQVEGVDVGPGPEHLENVLEMWAQDGKDDAVTEFLNINWKQKARFSDKSQFGMTEQQYISLSTAEKENNLSELSNLRSLCRHILQLGKNAAQDGKTENAKRYINAVHECGSFLSANPDGAKIVTNAGQAITKVASRELYEL